ncbi:MAG: hypothetical protein HQM01_05030 [Magnetococcales bacterium]|nr:hypothetical protein [Magnetococcales bacterium]
MKIKKYLGMYSVTGGKPVTGELRINKADTSVTLHSNEPLSVIRDGIIIEGVAYSGEYVTLIDCISLGQETHIKNSQKNYFSRIFPHFVTIGNCYLEPIKNYIKSIEFSTNDLDALFYDYDAFGVVTDSKKIIDAIIQDRGKTRPVETVEDPIIAYFSGKLTILTTKTEIGTISVRHQPTYNLGGPMGVYIKKPISYLTLSRSANKF